MSVDRVRRLRLMVALTVLVSLLVVPVPAGAARPQFSLDPTFVSGPSLDGELGVGSVGNPIYNCRITAEFDPGVSYGESKKPIKKPFDVVVTWRLFQAGNSYSTNRIFRDVEAGQTLMVDIPLNVPTNSWTGEPSWQLIIEASNGRESASYSRRFSAADCGFDTQS